MCGNPASPVLVAILQRPDTDDGRRELVVRASELPSIIESEIDPDSVQEGEMLHIRWEMWTDQRLEALEAGPEFEGW
jgi:hypothetical protein